MRPGLKVIVTVKKLGVWQELAGTFVSTQKGERGDFCTVKLDDGRDYKARPSTIRAA